MIEDKKMSIKKDLFSHKKIILYQFFFVQINSTILTNVRNLHVKNIHVLSSSSSSSCATKPHCGLRGKKN